MSKESLQPGIGVPLKQKEAPVLLEQRNKSLFPTEKKATSAPALSEMESEFIRELDEVLVVQLLFCPMCYFHSL